MMDDIVKLAQNLRKEHLFVNEQKQQIKTLNEKISTTCDNIFHVSWILRQQRLTLYDMIYSRKDSSLSTSTCDKANLIEQASFIDAYKALNNDSYITELLSSIRNNPNIISECLMQHSNQQNQPDSSAQHNNKQDCDPVAQILMSSVYGNAILHEDYMLTLRLSRNLIDKQLAPSEDPRKLLRQKSAAFSAVFKAFTESLLEAKLFLNSTLNDSILHVLGEDEFMLEIDPNKAAIRFAAQERHRQPSNVNSSHSSANSSSSSHQDNNGTNNHNPSQQSLASTTTASGLTSNGQQQQQQPQQTKLPEFASNTKLYKTYVTNRLVSFTAKFIEGIRDNIHCLPPSLLWIIKYVYLKLTEEGKLTDRQIRTVCSDLLFSSFICPAILYPDYYGVTDAYISPNGRFNLAQVAQIIQWLAVTNYEKEIGAEESLINIDASAPAGSKPTTNAATVPPSVNPSIAPRLNDIYSKFPADCVSSILDYVLSNTCDIDQAVDSVANCKDVSRTCFLITEAELSLLITFLEPIVTKLDTDDTDARDALIENIKRARTSFKHPLESHVKCKIKDKLVGHSSSAGLPNHANSSGLNSSGHGSATNITNNLSSSSNTNGSPRSRRNMLRRVTRKGFKSSSSSSDINPNNVKGNEMQCRCLACAGYQVLMVPFINRNTTNYITTILPEEKIDQTTMIENSEVASVNSVASSSLELENENDNLSDMVSAHVSSGRATPNVSGRNTPSQGSSDNADNIDGIGVIQGPLVDFSNDLPDVVQKDIQPPARPVDQAQAGPVQNAEIEIEDRFCKFDFKLELGVDETKSLLSDTWSTDVMASDCDFFPNFDSDYSALSYNAARLGLLNLRADDSNEPILRSRWPMMEPLISYADTATINDIKKKLRLVFGSVDLLYIPQPATLTADSPNDNENELVKYLKVLLSNASRLDSSDSVAIREAIRCVKPFNNSACQELLRSVLDDYDRRSSYMKDLVEFHQRLLIVSFRLDNVLHHIERDKLICNHNIVTLFVGQYMEQKERSVQFFIRKFQSINAADEKTQLVERFLNLLYNALENDSNWHRATQEQIDHARRIIERHIMTQIYWSAFYPNGEADVHRDKVLHEHMKKLSKIINVDHKDLRIPEVYHSEYPWPSAQVEIEVINSCKAARDKVSCVVKCCKTIMTLLSIADEKSTPSADDLMPVLVFVIIQANPNSLLSTVQYVNSFYEKHFHGEQAYWWTQFCSAIEFIKTMDYWETQ
uniref:Receptor-mediated endocytosis protein 6 homolog n=1 Tax=Aceria tosichella TaxID=561515 RepID=A0A6G1SMG5_9ACAR